MFGKKAAAFLLLAAIIAASSGAVLAAGTDAREAVPEAAAQARDKAVRINARFTEALDTLVKDGTITRQQKDLVLKAMEAKREKFQKEREKTKLRKWKRFKPHGRGHGFLKELVKDGTLTQDQADAIRKELRSARERKNKPK